MSAKPRPHFDADLTIPEACALLNLGRTTIHKLIADGTLQSYKLGPTRRAGRRIRRESIEHFRAGGAQ